MTDQEKLQKLFDAALRDSSPVEKAPTRAVPQPASPPPTAPIIAEKPAKPEVHPDRQVLEAAPELDKAAAEELGILLDAQILRQKRKRRRESLIAALVLLGLTGGGSAWFVQSPERVEAFASALREIRSVGDVKGMVAKYQDALNRISARGQQIDQATKAMGITSTGDEEDPYFEAEMQQMMGGEGKTVGGRAKGLKQAFGDMQKEHGDPAKQVASSLSEEESFEWDQ